MFGQTGPHPIQDFYLEAAASTATVKTDLKINENPNVQTTGFIRKHSVSVQSTGTNYLDFHFDPYLPVVGPAIVKLQAIGSAADIDAQGGFDGFIRTN